MKNATLQPTGIDTLTVADDLNKAGFTQPQAKALARWAGQFATKKDLERVESNLSNKIDGVDTKVDDVKKDLGNRIDDVKKDLSSRMDKLDQSNRDLHIKLDQNNRDLNAKLDQNNKDLRAVIDQNTQDLHAAIRGNFHNMLIAMGIMTTFILGVMSIAAGVLVAFLSN